MNRTPAGAPAQRILIIDHDDSFTFNLVDLVSRLSGCTPHVHSHRDARLPDLEGFDAVIVGPGPGHPQNPADIGVSRELLTAVPLPLLGVCLGHEGLAWAHGGRVGPAAEPRHGRLSPVHHTGEGIFAGLPRTPRVVRYHSLAVADPGPQLEVTARADDGTIMGLAHTSRPAWSVQFHPESIATEAGDALIANFLLLARQWNARHRPHCGLRAGIPDAEGAAVARVAGAVEAAGLAGVAGAAHAPRPDWPPGVRVHHRQAPLGVDAEALFTALCRHSEHAFWLDSRDSDHPDGRFSIIGDAAGPFARTAAYSVENSTLTLTDRTGTRRIGTGFFDWLAGEEAAFAELALALPQTGCGFALGWVGCLGYELKAECGSPNRHSSALPDAALIFADRAVIIDHHLRCVHALALTAPGVEEHTRQWSERVAQCAAGAPVAADTAWQPPRLPLRLRHDRSTYEGLIARCREHIRAGESYELCLTNALSGKHRLPPAESYRQLRTSSRSPLGAFVRFGELGVLSTSPERFLSVTAGGTAESKPIKGTRARAAEARADAQARAELALSEKERAENLMIVDLVRHDLTRTAEPHSIEVPALLSVESYATAHQLVSTVRAQLAEASTVVDCLRACFPGGSMTGAPKLRTMELLDELETGPRGLYSGALGYLSLSGAACFSMVIRTLIVTPDGWSYGVGGAITALSAPAEEFEETAVKAEPLLRLLRAEFPERRGRRSAGAHDAPAGVGDDSLSEVRDDGPAGVGDDGPAVPHGDRPGVPAGAPVQCWSGPVPT